MKQLFTIYLFLIFLTHVTAQNIVVTTGNAQREWSRNESKTEAESKVEEMATINAIERAFGRVVIQGNSTYMENSTDGRRVETKSNFSSIANTFVKGEVLEVLDKKFEEVKQTIKINGQKTEIVELICNIKVRVRELTEPKVEFLARTTPCEDEFTRCQSATFRHGDPFYLHFKTPESGYLMVFYDAFDGNTYKLLPSEAADKQYDNGIPVKSNTDYLFFSSRNNVFDNMGFSVMNAYVSEGKNREQLRIFIIFSKTPLYSVLTDKSNTTYQGVGTEKYKLPSSLSSEEFQRYVHKLKMTNAQCAFDYKDITIER